MLRWLVVDRPGVYRISLSEPGALTLFSYANDQAAAAGTERPRRERFAGSLVSGPVLEDLILTPGRPYLLGASARTDADLTFQIVGVLSPENTVPEAGNPLGDGRVVLIAEDDLEIELGGAPHVRVVSVESQVGADVTARLDAQDVPSGTGLLPWRNEQESTLDLDVSVPDGAPPPVIVIDVAQAESDVDETEPNDRTPNELTFGTEFRGFLLAEDRDTLRLDLPSPAAFALDIAAEPWAAFEVELSADSDERSGLLWSRKSDRGRMAAETLSLDAGRYVLSLNRTDDAPLVSEYSIATRRTAAPGQSFEAEPNDTAMSANRLAGDLFVRGTLAPDDIDHHVFTIPADMPGRLWRAFGTGIDRIVLLGPDGRTIESFRNIGSRVTLEPLALEPGEHGVLLEGDGDYTFRVQDLGPRPEAFEGEPNGSQFEAETLRFGVPARGTFHRRTDADFFAFTLSEESPVTITLQGAGEGESRAQLYWGNAVFGGEHVFGADGASATYEMVLSGGEWFLRMEALEGSGWGSYEVRVDAGAGAAIYEPDADILDAPRMPRSGDFAGRVGGLDDSDWIVLALPTAPGTVGVLCSGDFREATLWNWRFELGTPEGDRIANFTDGMLVWDAPESKHGLYAIRVEGGDRPGDYSCRARLASGAIPRVPIGEGGGPLAADTGMDIPDEADGRTSEVSLDVPEGGVAFVGCAATDRILARPSNRTWTVRGGRILADVGLGGLYPVRGGPDTTIRVFPAFLDDGGGARCIHLTPDRLARPSSVPDLAVHFAAPGADGDPGNPAFAAPPGLEAYLSEPIESVQPRGDLPLDIAFPDLRPVAAYNAAGQRFRLPVTIAATAGSEVAIDVQVEAHGAGWRVAPERTALTVQPGAPTVLELEITAPPWVGVNDRPGISIVASSGERFAQARLDPPIDLAAEALDPFPYWHAPDSLRGGLNVLHRGLGAALIEIDGKPASTGYRDQRGFVHDGTALHVAQPGFAKSSVFRLPAEAEVAGAAIQLRSASDPGEWPAEVVFRVPAADGRWPRIGAASLDAVPYPQFVAFDEPATTNRIRVDFPRCHAPCREVKVQDIAVIATPGTHPDGLAPINIADPALGGHVVHAAPSAKERWHDYLLTAAERRNDWPTSEPPRTAVIGFHQNRAARIEAIEWAGHPEDDARLAGARVSVSLHSPAGPWQDVGEIEAPGPGASEGTLRLLEPRWARYVRLDFAEATDAEAAGPDAIRVLEAPGRSVLGLWEDDDPRGAFEHDVPSSVERPAPADGADRTSARALPLETEVRSTVELGVREDWWRIDIPEGPSSVLRLSLDDPEGVVRLRAFDPAGDALRLYPDPDSPGVFRTVHPVAPGAYLVEVYEPPRSIVISWDTSGSVEQYVGLVLAAVRSWARGLEPGREAINLVPFGAVAPLLPDFSDDPLEIERALVGIEPDKSSRAEQALRIATEALADREGAKGIVLVTDAETPMDVDLWPQLLAARPKVVALSIDSSTRRDAEIMMDWAHLNGGRFRRITGPRDLADAMDMAEALFRTPKPYTLTAALAPYVELTGEGTLTIVAEDGTEAIGGAVEVILDASGSMLQRLGGRPRIEVAREALTRLVRDTLPEGLPFAFRVFGLEEDSCQTELRLPPGPLVPGNAAAAIARVRAINLARTPIAASLLAAGEDLRDAAEPRVIVLVTDGEETCDGDPEAAIDALKETGLDVTVNIVGFAIDDRALAETFSDWAEAGGGRYFDARDAAALDAALAGALLPRFALERVRPDGTVEVLGEAALGETVTVPAGEIRVLKVFPSEGRVDVVMVRQNETTVIRPGR